MRDCEWETQMTDRRGEGAGGRGREACRATPEPPAEGAAEGAGSAWHVGLYRR